MAVAAPALFTAGQDCTIRVWNFNEQAGIFMSAVSSTACVWTYRLSMMYVIEHVRSQVKPVWRAGQDTVRQMLAAYVYVSSE
jgi:hypothetical protein